MTKYVCMHAYIKLALVEKSSQSHKFSVRRARYNSKTLYFNVQSVVFIVQVEKSISVSHVLYVYNSAAFPPYILDV